VSDPRRRYGALTSAQVAALDAAAVAAGVEVVQLMEVAGWQVARCAWRLLGRRPADLVVIAGRGNNGGDGLVAARHLATWGCAVSAAVLGTAEQLRGLLPRQVEAARAGGVEVRLGAAAAEVSARVATASLVVDGLLGTGLRSAPREPDAAVIRALTGARVLSIDVPSGLDASTGEAFDPCVHASVTCTLAAVKAGFWQRAAAPWLGRLMVADIGMPAAAWAGAGLAPPAAVRGGVLLPVPTASDFS
jgi:NAD(P)H-hydrate epimerase